jgi:hypothetical protein
MMRPIVTTDPPETIEWLLRECREALNRIPNTLFRGGHSSDGVSSTYQLARKLDDYLEPMVHICRIDGPKGSFVGIGRSREDALADAADQVSEGQRHTIFYSERRLRARDPAREIPKAK